MKDYALIAPRPRDSARAIPPFQTVPARARSDGWTPRRQAEFIGHLAETRSVSIAARRVAMARESAYRLRQRPAAESFCAAWDAALGRPWRARRNTAAAKVTAPERSQRVEASWWRVRLRGGKFVGLDERHDNSALLRLLAMLARAGSAGPEPASAAKVT